MMKKHLLFSVLILSLLTLSSCQTLQKRQWTSDDLIIGDQASLKFPGNLTSAQAKEDIDFLIFALSKAYGGRKYVPGDSFTKAVEALKSVSNVSSLEKFHDQLDEALFLIPDNHLMAYYKGNVSGKRSANEKKGLVGLNDIRDPQKAWEVRPEKVGKKKVLYISIVAFPDANDPVWNGFIASVKSHLKLSDSVILDLRGNHGGDDRKGMELAKLFFGHDFEHPIKRQYINQTPEVFALSINDLQVKMINLKYQGKETPSWLSAELQKAKEDYAKAKRGDFSLEQIRTSKGTGNRKDPITGFKKPIYVLMDGVCGSSCEFTIAALEWHNQVKRVGENTSGTFHFSNAKIAVLPNSRIKVMIPSLHSEYFDQRFIERIGFTPDIKVPAGQNAYSFVKDLIKTK